MKTRTTNGWMAVLILVLLVLTTVLGPPARAQTFRLNAKTATSTWAADDRGYIDGTTNGVRAYNPTADVRAVLNAANAAAIRTALGLVIGTNVQGLDDDLTDLGGLTAAQGDLIIGNATGDWIKLAKDANATRYLSNTGASNSPAWAQINLANGVTGTLPVANGGTGLTYDSINGAAASVASATTTDLGAQTSNHVSITGTTTITGFGTVAAGVERTGRFTGSLTLTHNATSLILPGGSNITTAAGDSFCAMSLGSGNWVVLWYVKADGTAIVGGGGGGGDFSSNTATSVDSEVVLFSGTGGKTGKRATGTGIARLASGVLSAAELSGDVVTSGSNAATIQANSVALTTDTTGNYAAGDAEAGAALTGDSATGFFSTGTLEDARLPATMADKTMSGIWTQGGARVVTTPAISSNTIDVTKADQTATITGNVTLTLSGTPATANTWFGFTLSADSSGPYTVTLPAGTWYSESLGANRTTFVVGASQTASIVVRYDGSTYRIFGDPVTINDLTADASPSAANDYVQTWDASAGQHKKVLLQNLPAAGVDDTAFASSWNGVTGSAPSKNAVYDWAHTIDTDDDGKVNAIDAVTVAGFLAVSSSGVPTEGRVLQGGAGVDISNTSGAAGDPSFTVDLTEMVGNQTWGDGSTDTIAHTFNRATGTDPVMTINNGSFGLTALTLGTDLAVADGGTGLSSGTSGGVPYFSGSTTMASSAALAANALVVGGGAGAAPATVTTGTGVLTALGVNTGSAGAFQVNNASGAALTALNDDEVAFDDADNLWTATAVGPALEELNDSINAGAPNGTGAKVHWSQLLGVPAGFADGTDDGAGGATLWDAIGDAAGDGTIALGAHETDFTSTIDAAGEAIWTLTNTDADAANDNSFIDLKHNDLDDANVYYQRWSGDADGTPTDDYLWGQTQATIRPLAVFQGGATISAPLTIPQATTDATLSAAGQLAINTTDEQLSWHSAADGEVSGEVSVSAIRTFAITFDPKAVCDGAVDRLFLFRVGDDAPEGITIDEWSVSFEADPTTEVDLDLKSADAPIGVANAATLDALDTTAGAATEDTDANINGGAVVANGKWLYLEFGTAYTEANHQIVFQIWYHNEED